MKGYLRIELNRETGKYFAAWYYDPQDPDETTIVLDIKKILRHHGCRRRMSSRTATTKEPEVSTEYEDIGVDPPYIQATVRGCRGGDQAEGLFPRAPRRRRRPLPDALRHRVRRRPRAHARSTFRSARPSARTSACCASSRWSTSASSPVPLILGSRARLGHGRPRADAGAAKWRRRRSASPAQTSACAFPPAAPATSWTTSSSRSTA